MAPSPYHRTWIRHGDCDHVSLSSIISLYRKRFIGDILHIVILVFSADILTLNVKIWCPGLVKRNYGQLDSAIVAL